MTDTGKIELEVPRDRQASFDPQLIAKYQRPFPGFDDKIVSMYARGMSTPEITGHLRDLYGIEVSPNLISAVTDAVLEEITVWQTRPLEPIYPLVFFDALRVKIRDEGLVRNKAVHLTLGVRAAVSCADIPPGDRAYSSMAPRRSSACGWSRTPPGPLGPGSIGDRLIRLLPDHGAKFWLRVMHELKNRGIEDVLIAVVDGLKGFPEAILAVFAEATIQTCVVYLLRTAWTCLSGLQRPTGAMVPPHPTRTTRPWPGAEGHLSRHRRCRRRGGACSL